jgi:hypothetical protein
MAVKKKTRSMRKTRKMKGGKNPEAGEYSNDDILKHPNISNLNNCLVNLNQRCINDMNKMIQLALNSRLDGSNVTYNTFFGAYNYGGVLGIGGSTNLAREHLTDPSRSRYLSINVYDSDYTVKDIINSLEYSKSIDYFKLAVDVKRTSEMYSGSNKSAIYNIKVIINDLRSLILGQLLRCDVCDYRSFNSYLDTSSENILFETCRGSKTTMAPAPTPRSTGYYGSQYSTRSFGWPGMNTLRNGPTNGKASYSKTLKNRAY